MKVITILFLLDIILALDFIKSSCSSETCLSNLKTYVEELKYHIICEKNKGRLICKIPLRKPPVEETSGLSIVAYAINQITGEKHPIQDVYREDDDENAFFVVSLTAEEIKNNKACKKIKDEIDYFKRQCEIVWVYISTPSSSLLMKQTYTLGIEGTSRSGEFGIIIPIVVEPIVEEVCSCVIDVTLKNRREMYLGMDCNQPLNHGSVVTFGDYICLAVFGDDPISKSSYLEVDTILAHYTDNEGNPAPYSKDNIPLVPKWYFPISISGVKEGDFAMIIGFPGSTDRFLTSYGVKMAIEEKNPTIVKVRDTKLVSWRAFRNADPVIDLQYASKYARISNYWKYYIGQTQQLKNNQVFAKKEQIEKEFQTWVNKNNKKEYTNILSDVRNAYGAISKLEKFNVLYQQAIFDGPEIFSLIRQYRPIYDLLKKQEDDILTDDEKSQLEIRLSLLKSRLDNFFKNYNIEVDKATSAKLFELFYNETTSEQRPKIFNESVKKSKNDFTKLTENLFKKTMFSDKNLLEKFLQNPKTKDLDKDLAYKWLDMFVELYYQTRDPLDSYFEILNKSNRLFIKGLMEMNPDKLYAPNANSQIRLTYGKVGGYPIKDGLTANYYTTMDGVVAKEDPNSREFKIPEKLKMLYQNKDFEQYAEDGRLHVCFLTDNDITGGNSGSPVINGKGELIGCAFDGNWEAMSGDIFFEPVLQRCINVDIRYVLFIIDKFGDAKHLIDEMKLVK